MCNNTISSLFHWNTSLPYGSEYVNYEEVVKGTLKNARGNVYSENDNGVMLEDLSSDFYMTRSTQREMRIDGYCSMKEIAYIISNSLKVTYKNRRMCVPYPSAGAIYSIENYFICNKVENVKKGIYRYNQYAHMLEDLNQNINLEEISSIFLNQDFTMSNRYCFACIMVVNIEKIECKYGDRGYRYSLLEAGHIAQNLYLTAIEEKVKVVAVGGFVDYQINELLGLETEKYFPIYALFFGK